MKKPIKTHICPVIQMYADKRVAKESHNENFISSRLTDEMYVNKYVAKTPTLKALRERNEALRALIVKSKKIA